MQTKQPTGRGAERVTLNGGESGSPTCERSTSSTPTPSGRQEGSAITPTSPKNAPMLFEEMLSVDLATDAEETELGYLASLIAARSAGRKD